MASQTDLEPYFESRPDVKGGAPVVKGSRLTVSAARINGGRSYESVLEDYDYLGLTREMIDAALGYARKHRHELAQYEPARPWRE